MVGRPCCTQASPHKAVLFLSARWRASTTPLLAPSRTLTRQPPSTRFASAVAVWFLQAACHPALATPACPPHSLGSRQGLQAAEGQRKDGQAQQEELEGGAQQAGRSRQPAKGGGQLACVQFHQPLGELLPELLCALEGHARANLRVSAASRRARGSGGGSRTSAAYYPKAEGAGQQRSLACCQQPG